jgi:hypothetical protein
MYMIFNLATEQHLAGHPEVKEDLPAVIQCQKEILTPTAYRRDYSAGHARYPVARVSPYCPGHKRARERVAELSAQYLDLR